MPKNHACPGVPRVSDPITDQEMAFAHLIMSGTMNDRRAAEAVGLNADSAAYIKYKPRIRAYMVEHRAAVREKLVDQEAEGLRKLNLGRDQTLTRLWELATLSSIPQPLNRVPAATHGFFDVVLDATGPLKLPYSVKPGYLARSRSVEKRSNFIEFYKLPRRPQAAALRVARFSATLKTPCVLHRKPREPATSSWRSTNRSGLFLRKRPLRISDHPLPQN